jgi:hypothetical protein
MILHWHASSARFNWQTINLQLISGELLHPCDFALNFAIVCIYSVLAHNFYSRYNISHLAVGMGDLTLAKQALA